MPDSLESFDRIDNHRLIYNGLEHVEFELGRPSTSYFRVAREAHQVLYRSLVATLKGTSNIAVTGRPRGRRGHRYQLGNEPVKEIHKESISGCDRAWRFSTPTNVQKPFESDNGKVSSSQYRVPSFNRRELNRPSESQALLIPFYDALAMVQTENFMFQYGRVQTVSFSDKEMNLLERLHELIRNVYEHFVPKTNSALIHDLLQATQLALNKSSACLFDCGHVIYYPHSVPKTEMESKIQNVLVLVDTHIKLY